MDVTVGVYEAKTNLPKLLDRVARGRRITITRYGVPVALLVPPGETQVRPIGEVIAAPKEFGKGRRFQGMSHRAAIVRGRR